MKSPSYQRLPRARARSPCAGRLAHGIQAGMDRRILPALLCIACTACTQLPELENTVPPSVAAQKYPALLPFDQLTVPNAEDHSEDTTVADRSDALRARAAQLQGGVVDAQTRGRMQTGIPAQ